MGLLQCFLCNVAAINFVIQFILFPVMSLAQEMLTKVSRVYMYLQMALILRVGCTSAHVHVQSIWYSRPSFVIKNKTNKQTVLHWWTFLCDKKNKNTLHCTWIDSIASLQALVTSKFMLENLLCTGLCNSSSILFNYTRLQTVRKALEFIQSTSLIISKPFLSCCLLSCCVHCTCISLHTNVISLVHSRRCVKKNLKPDVGMYMYQCHLVARVIFLVPKEVKFIRTTLKNIYCSSCTC